MTMLQVTQLLDEADELLDNKFHFGSFCLFINYVDFQYILSKVRAILPDEIKEAERILKRRDDIYMEAQNRAERIINEAQTKASSILSESELIKAVKEKASIIQEQVRNSCEEMKNKAAEEAEELRSNAYKEALKTRENTKTFVENMLTSLESDIDKVHKHIKSCQEYMINQNKDKNSVNNTSIKKENVNLQSKQRNEQATSKKEQ